MTSAVQRRLNELERQQKRQQEMGAASQWVREFRVVPTCPPTTAVRVLRGKMYTSTGYWAWIDYNCWIGELLPDFADPLGSELYSGVAGSGVVLDLTFSNAYWYRGLILGFNSDWVFYHDDPDATYDDGIFWARGADVEYATSTEAEARLDSMLNGNATVMYGSTFPLYALVLRNDGRTGTNGAVQAVDLVNRQRSYLYRDVRVRNRITA